MTAGRSMPRVEDEGLLLGRARFVDDLEAAREAVHMVLVRSPFAHARVTLGSAPPGMELIVATDVPDLTWPHLLPGLPPRRPLAGDRVRHVGEPVAAIMAEKPRDARDMAAALEVDYESLEAATTVEDALRPDAPLVYEDLGTNLVYRDQSSIDPDLFATADRIVRRRFRNHRVSPGMMECRAALAVPDQAGVLIYVGHQNPHKLQAELAAALGLDSEQVRVVVPEVGGAFGAKAPLYPEYLLVAWAALQMGRPVKYIETRSENLLLAVHGRAQAQRVEAGVTRDGQITALRAVIDGDLGAAVDSQRWCLALTRLMISGAYRIPRIEWDVRGVLTHTPPVGAFRGAGRPEAAYLIERLVDEVARELGLDSNEVRRRNFIQPHEFPYVTPTGATYDSGSYRTALDLASDRLGYEEMRAREEANDPGSRHLTGVGFASYVEMSASGQEYGSVELGDDGSVVARTGSSPHGQGHETTWTQLVVDRLGIEAGSVTILHGDTGLVPRGGGTSGSRSASLAGSALDQAASGLADELRKRAGELLEANPVDIVLSSGRAEVTGSPGLGVSLANLAADAGGRIEVEHLFEAKAQNHPYGTHACVVDIDTETGVVSIIKYVAIDDPGRLINPLIVEGQIRGAILQGVSYALAEEARFDEQGQMLNGSFTSYPLPMITSALHVESGRIETPSPTNPLGVKGVGESGVTGATAAVANAVFSALAPLGIGEESLSMPFTPDKVWAAVSR